MDLTAERTREGDSVKRNRKERDRRKNLCLFLLFSLILTGCGGNAVRDGIAVQGNRNNGTERAASEGAVSGGAVSAGAVSGGTIRGGEGEIKAGETAEQTDDKKYRCCTDTNLYYTDEAGTMCESVIMQARFDGTHKKRLVGSDDYDAVDISVVYADRNGLYYLTEEEDFTDVLYYVPIEKDAEGYDVVKMSGAEQLKRESIYAIYADSHYMIYNTDEEIVKIDMREKKIYSRQKLPGMGKQSDACWNFFRLSDYFVAVSSEGGVFAQETEGAGWKSIGNKQWQNIEDEKEVVQTGNHLFYQAYEGDDLAVLKCDGERTEPFITLEQVGKAVENARGAKAAAAVNGSAVTNLFGDAGRLYLQVSLLWEEDGVTRAEYVLLSRGEAESELRFEKKLTECMQSKEKNRRGRWGSMNVATRKLETVYAENAVMNDAQCVYMMDGKAYLSLYDYENDKGRLGCYELQSGAFRWISENEAKYGYGLLGCAGVFNEGIQLSGVFEEGDFTGIWSFPAGWREDVRFYETK